MNKHRIIIVVFLIHVLTAYLFSNKAFSEIIDPILNNTILPNYFCSKFRNSSDSICVQKDENEIEVNFGVHREMWESMSKNEFEKAMKQIANNKLKREQIDLTSVAVDIYTFKSNSEALSAIDAIRSSGGIKLPLGSYSGEIIGEKCWAHKGNNIDVAFFKMVGFLKGNKIVQISASNYMKEVSTSFVENIAKAVAVKI